MEGLKIGITIGLKSNTESIWTNGIKQNILMLHRLLKNSHKKYEVFLLNTIDVDWSTKPSYLDDVNISYFDDNYENMDFIIVMGAQIDSDKMLKFKSIKKENKIISYKCGSNYILTTENILFKNDDKWTHIESSFDELWYIPQQHETNVGYYHTLYRTNTVVVPFIWHHKYLVEAIIDIDNGHKKGKFKKSFKYNPDKETKVLGIMEPNLNMVKFCLIPTMIAEESYRGKIGKSKIEKLMITNSKEVAKNKEFMSMLKTFDLFADKKITSESRYQTSYIVTQFLDILICHQLLNPLNYLYLDVAFMGYPVLHNAPMCKDIGYYYEGSDTVEAAKMLDWILENHDSNLKEYEEKNKKALFRYFADNRLLIETYDKLIFNLFNGGNNGLVYDETTNNYK
jgi:hypothetical protein